MDIYFIRHGQTEGNRRHRHQSLSEPLNERGRQQAAAVAQIVSSYQPTHLITSPLVRAKETAAAIATSTGLAPIEQDIFAEILRPTSVRGIHYADPRSLWYMVRWFFSGRHVQSNETLGESYRALVLRIEAAKQFLEQLPEDARVVVVSHSVFINFFVAHICSRKPISLIAAFLRFAKIINLDNSSITHVRCHKTNALNTCNFELVSFDNDGHVI